MPLPAIAVMTAPSLRRLMRDASKKNEAALKNAFRAALFLI